jgi:hypothetical protein
MARSTFPNTALQFMSIRNLKGAIIIGVYTGYKCVEVVPGMLWHNKPSTLKISLMCSHINKLQSILRVTTVNTK